MYDWLELAYKPVLNTSEYELNAEANEKQLGISYSKCPVSQLTCYKQVDGQDLQKSEYQIWNP